MRFGKPQYEAINALLNARFAEKGTLIAAHRGSWRGNIIQNTLAAYRAALMMGADLLETDTTATKDSVVYSLHDGVEPVLLGLPRNAMRLNSDTVDRYPTLNALGVPTRQHVERLETVFEGLTHGELLNIDRSWRANGLVVPLLDRYPHMLRQALIKAPLREKAVLEQLNEHPTKYMFMPICYSLRDVEEALQYKELNLVGAELIAFTDQDELYSDEAIGYIHSKGLFTWVNALTLTDVDPKKPLYGPLDDDRSIIEGPEKGWGVLMEKGIDVIQTDWPALVKNYRVERYNK